MSRLPALLLLLTLFVLISTAAAQTEPLPDHPFFEHEHDGPLVIAHQGGEGLRPSNTMIAFEHAVELGVDVLELDIHSTSDGVIVVIHDDTVDRTTDGSGRVQDFTFEELQTLDAGYEWPTLEEVEVEGHPYRGQGITIPALEEVLQAFPDMRMVIEIKQETPSITEPFCEMLREVEMTEQVLVASFSRDVLDEFREVCPEVVTSGEEQEIFGFYFLARQGRAEEFEPLSYAFQVPERSGRIEVLVPEFLEAAQAANIDVHVWTINQAEDMERLIDLGVDGIITDFPDVLLELLGRAEGE
ncbi:MAG: glycerophosphodiester phosphodiesterase [bacterium]|nr:glycerophosphodiester phosphodiesterase [bacterium]